MSQIDPVFTSEAPTFDMSSVEEENGLDGEDGCAGGSVDAGGAGGEVGNEDVKDAFNNFNYVAPEHEALDKK